MAVRQTCQYANWMQIWMTEQVTALTAISMLGPSSNVILVASSPRQLLPMRPAAMDNSVAEQR